jgi:hypothetical protein
LNSHPTVRRPFELAIGDEIVNVNFFYGKIARFPLNAPKPRTYLFRILDGLLAVVHCPLIVVDRISARRTMYMKKTALLGVLDYGFKITTRETLVGWAHELAVRTEAFVQLYVFRIAYVLAAVPAASDTQETPKLFHHKRPENKFDDFPLRIHRTTNWT